MVAFVLLRKAISLRRGATIYTGTIVKQHESEARSFWIEFDSRRHQDLWVDLELPGLVKDGEFSYWRLDGYKHYI